MVYDTNVREVNQEALTGKRSNVPDLDLHDCTDSDALWCARL